jgi:DNA-directed RNA polymerase specialized sigma subunit
LQQFTQHGASAVTEQRDITEEEWEEAAAELAEWRAMVGRRDALISDALDYGLTPTEIHRVMGVSRAHIYRLLGRKQQCQTTPA